MDVIAEIDRDLALAAKRTRQDQGLDSVRPAPDVGPLIDTTPFAKRCGKREEWKPGAMHRTCYATILVSELPANVVALLRVEGCGPWTDDPDEVIDLGEWVCLSVYGQGTFGPRPSIPLAEIVKGIKTSPTPAERKALARENAKALARAEAERRTAEERRTATDIAARAAAEEERFERERRRSPAYCARMAEQAAAKNEGVLAQIKELAAKVLGAKPG